MNDFKDKKRCHSLHECKDAEEFLARFEKDSGHSLPSCTRKLVDLARVAASILGGSIPLGIGTSASDIDLILLIDSKEALHLPAGNDEEIIFSGEPLEDENGPEIASIVALISHLEVDFLFVSTSRVRELSERVRGQGILLAEPQIRLLSRIKTGWLLARSPSFDSAFSGLLRDNSLEIHCTVSYFVTALKELEDGQAALADNLAQAIYLGRSCAEKCFISYFASQGYAYLGSKWLRFLTHYCRTCWDERHQGLRDMVSLGLPLLFPALTTDAEVAARYLADVAKLVMAARCLMEEDTTYKLAFRMCPQIYEPLSR